MPGENPLPIQEAPDVRNGAQTITFPAAGDMVDQYWFYCEKITVIDAAFARLITEPDEFSSSSASDSGDIWDDLPAIQLVSVPNSTAIASGTAVTDQLPISSVGGSTYDNLNRTFTLKGQTIEGVRQNTIPSGNKIPAGSWVAIRFLGTMTGATGLAVHVRCREMLR